MVGLGGPMGPSLSAMFGGLRVIVADKQQQARTDIVGWFPSRERPKLKTRKQGRKCSRRSARRPCIWRPHPIFAEPTDVIQFGDKIIVTPNQLQALNAEIDKRNRAHD